MGGEGRGYWNCSGKRGWRLGPCKRGRHGVKPGCSLCHRWWGSEGIKKALLLTTVVDQMYVPLQNSYVEALTASVFIFTVSM